MRKTVEELKKQEPVHILSMGAGVQSTTMAMMFIHQEFSKHFPMPDYAIFADTQAEPDHVYRQLEWLKERVPFPINVATKGGGLRQHIIDSIKGQRFAGAPFFTESPNGKKSGMLRRQCTKEFKIEVIQKEVRRLVGLEYKQRSPKKILAYQYIGISTDEASRMKPSGKVYIENQYPLLELRISRSGCLTWMKKNNYPLPNKSACTFCPYRDNQAWIEMMKEDPKSFSDACEIDELIRNGVRGTKEKLYVHRRLIPLREAVLKVSGECDQQTDLFDEECEGMCGL